MTKLQFLFALHDKLSALPQDDIEERLSFYGEMVEDRMEEGLSEEDAVASIGSVEELAAQISADFPTAKPDPKSEPKQKTVKPKKRRKAWEIVFLVLGSPIWFSVLIAAFAVLFSIIVSLWAVIISLWAVFASFVGCAFGCLVAGIVFAVFGNGLVGIAVIGGALVCAGIAILWFFGCKAGTKGALLLTKNIVPWIISLFVKKEEA